MEESAEEVRISVVMPCLNEEDTIAQCIEAARDGLLNLSMNGEIIVVDNGSTDRSAEIAQSVGARVVHQPKRGYGNAYRKGFSVARGNYLVMGDSDGTYDFRELVSFISPLAEGYDLVMCSRLAGEILPGAMPWLHQYIGVPFLTWLLNYFAGTRISDAHCGMRALTEETLEQLELRTTGMEFASEMVIRAGLAGSKIAEVPITYYKRGGESKLNTFRDGWRHLRFLLLFIPNHLFLIPGLLLATVGLVLLFLLLPGPVQLGPLNLGIHYVLLGSFMAIVGLQIVSLALSIKVYATTQHYRQTDRAISALLKAFNLERGLALGFCLSALGVGIILYILSIRLSGTVPFGGQNYLRAEVLAMTSIALGVQTIFSSLFLSIMGISKD